MTTRVSITIAGRAYEIGCDDGQEDVVRALAAGVDRRAMEVLRAVGPESEARLLLMVALTLADELAEAERARGGASVAADGADAGLAAAVAGLARRIEAIADSLERT